MAEAFEVTFRKLEQKRKEQEVVQAEQSFFPPSSYLS